MTDSLCAFLFQNLPDAMQRGAVRRVVPDRNRFASIALHLLAIRGAARQQGMKLLKRSTPKVAKKKR
jgi:hypothetical protein